MPALAERGAEREAVEGLLRAVTRTRRIVADCLSLIARLEPHIRPASGERDTLSRGGTEIKRLSADDVRDRLSEFERAYLASTGERLSSADFYARFCEGEFDDRFGMRWATFFEAAEQLVAGNGTPVRA